MRWCLSPIALVLSVAGAASAADSAAADTSAGPVAIDEIRLGILAHDVAVFTAQREAGADANLEILFASPEWLERVLAPRPHVGISVNSVGDTSQAYAGLTWTWDLSDVVFVEGSLGGAVHDGKLTSERTDRAELGSRVLFRESIGLGWRLDARNSVSLMFDHVSNARLASRNEGLDNFGLRWGYRF